LEINRQSPLGAHGFAVSIKRPSAGDRIDDLYDISQAVASQRWGSIKYRLATGAGSARPVLDADAIEIRHDAGSTFRVETFECVREIAIQCAPQATPRRQGDLSSDRLN
jgi:hypothetical protein